QLGDPYARERLYGFWFNRVYAFFSMVGPGAPHEIEARVQDAFIRIFDALPSYDFGTSFRTWVARVIVPRHAAGYRRLHWPGEESTPARRNGAGEVVAAETLTAISDSELTALVR